MEEVLRPVGVYGSVVVFVGSNRLVPGRDDIRLSKPRDETARGLVRDDSLAVWPYGGPGGAGGQKQADSETEQ